MRCVKFQIAGPKGRHSRTGWVGRCEDLIVHRMAEDDWRVTHNRSGWAVCTELQSREAAFWAANKLAKLVDWSQTKAKLYAMGDDLKAKAREIQSKARER